MLSHVDAALEQHLNNLVSLANLVQLTNPMIPTRPLPKTENPADGMGTAVGKATPVAGAASAGTAQGFQVGDRVRLRLGRPGSSAARLQSDATGALFCGRRLPGGTGATCCAAAACSTCRACAALGARPTALDSARCLGPASAGREGVVQAVEHAPAAAGEGCLVRVVSLRTATACTYASDDLLYADGSIPGPLPRIPFVGPATTPLADWHARLVAQLGPPPPGAAMGEWVRMLLDGDPGALRQVRGDVGDDPEQMLESGSLAEAAGTSDRVEVRRCGPLAVHPHLNARSPIGGGHGVDPPTRRPGIGPGTDVTAMACHGHQYNAYILSVRWLHGAAAGPVARRCCARGAKPGNTKISESRNLRTLDLE
jgi:hypothetical protein